MESLAATVIHHSALPAPPCSPSVALLSSFNGQRGGRRTIPKREGGENEERVGGKGVSEPTSLMPQFRRLSSTVDFFPLMITAHLTGWKNFWSSSNKSWHVLPCATVNKRLGDYGAGSTFDLTENFVNTPDR